MVFREVAAPHLVMFAGLAARFAGKWAGAIAGSRRADFFV